LSYRDYPTTGIGALRVQPDPGVSPGQLLTDSGASLYLLRLVAPVITNTLTDTFRLRAQGVWLKGGAVEGFQPMVEVSGALSMLLRRTEAVGTDLAWYQTSAGFVEAPTLFVTSQRITV